MKQLLVMLCVLILVTPAPAENLVANGDFEQGDLRGTLPRWWQKAETEVYPLALAPGWTEAGPDTIEGWRGAKPVPVQFFREQAPMYVYEVSTDDTGIRHIKRVAVERQTQAKAGYSVGWTLAGSPKQGYPWISQAVRVEPGKYLMNASWDVLADNRVAPKARPSTGGMFMVNTDENIDRYTTEKTTCAETVWNDESAGKWVSKSVKDFPIETKTGTIEVRLMFVENGKDPIPADKYSTVAFDNVVFELTPVVAE